jgi:hypothetical protein
MENMPMVYAIQYDIPYETMILDGVYGSLAAALVAVQEEYDVNVSTVPASVGMPEGTNEVTVYSWSRAHGSASIEIVAHRIQ